jgi:hypothetical protein
MFQDIAVGSGADDVQENRVDAVDDGEVDKARCDTAADYGTQGPASTGEEEDPEIGV